MAFAIISVVVIIIALISIITTAFNMNTASIIILVHTNAVVWEEARRVTTRTTACSFLFDFVLYFLLQTNP